MLYAQRRKGDLNLPGVLDSFGIMQRTKCGWVLLKLVISFPRFSCWIRKQPCKQPSILFQILIEGLMSHGFRHIRRNAYIKSYPKQSWHCLEGATFLLPTFFGTFSCWFNTPVKLLWFSNVIKLNKFGDTSHFIQPTYPQDINIKFFRTIVSTK